METLLQAVSEPTRREILHLVAGREVTASEVGSHFDMSGPAVSQHLRVLREAGLVIVRRDGTKRFYSADQDALAALLRWLDDYWSLGLLELKQSVERESAAKRRRVKKSQKARAK